MTNLPLSSLCAALHKAAIPRFNILTVRSVYARNLSRERRRIRFGWFALREK